MSNSNTKTKKIVLLYGDPSHGPGAHEYEDTARLIKVLLEHSAVGAQVRVEMHAQGWPADEQTLEDADLIVVNSDGRDGPLFQDVDFVLGERMSKMEKLMKRGCGLVLLHFSTFFTREEGVSILEWAGGYYEWEDEHGERNWYSKISIGDRMTLLNEDHPIQNGVIGPIKLNDEVYWKLRMRQPDGRRINLGQVDAFEDAENDEAGVLAWALEREDGGRAFVTTVGHAYSLWENPDYRKWQLNALVWAAGLEVPAAGVETPYRHLGEVRWALAGIDGEAISRCPDEASRVWLVSGNEAHKWHAWEQTHPEIVSLLTEDTEQAVIESFDIHDFGRYDLSDVDVIILNYCNWQDPAGMNEASRQALLNHVKQGKGLVVLHFANGAFHFSLPEAGESDWPTYRELVARVWNHHGQGEQASGHDAYGPFAVQITDLSHPITAGIADFELTDELYFRQNGELPVHVLYEAKSQVTGQAEPLAWTYSYESARIYQTLLGHDGKAYACEAVRETLRRAVKWVQGVQGTN